MELFFHYPLSCFSPTQLLNLCNRLQGQRTGPRRARGVASLEIHLFMRHAATPVSSCVQSCQGSVMSLHTVGATISRSLRATSTTRTPPFVRPPDASRLAASRWASTDKSEGRAIKEERQSQGDSTTPGGPHSEVPASREPQGLGCPPGDKSKAKEHTGAPRVGGGKKRAFTSRALRTDRKTSLWARYNDMKRLVHGKQTSFALYNGSFAL